MVFGLGKKEHDGTDSTCLALNDTMSVDDLTLEKQGKYASPSKRSRGRKLSKGDGDDHHSDCNDMDSADSSNVNGRGHKTINNNNNNNNSNDNSNNYNNNPNNSNMNTDGRILKGSTNSSNTMSSSEDTAVRRSSLLIGDLIASFEQTTEPTSSPTKERSKSRGRKAFASNVVSMMKLNSTQSKQSDPTTTTSSSSKPHVSSATGGKAASERDYTSCNLAEEDPAATGVNGKIMKWFFRSNTSNISKSILDNNSNTEDFSATHDCTNGTFGRDYEDFDESSSASLSNNEDEGDVTLLPKQPQHGSRLSSSTQPSRMNPRILSPTRIHRNKINRGVVVMSAIPLDNDSPVTMFSQFDATNLAYCPPPVSPKLQQEEATNSPGSAEDKLPEDELKHTSQTSSPKSPRRRRMESPRRKTNNAIKSTKDHEEQQNCPPSSRSGPDVALHALKSQNHGLPSIQLDEGGDVDRKKNERSQSSTPSTVVSSEKWELSQKVRKGGHGKSSKSGNTTEDCSHHANEGSDPKEATKSSSSRNSSGTSSSKTKSSSTQPHDSSTSTSPRRRSRRSEKPSLSPGLKDISELSENEAEVEVFSAPTTPRRKEHSEHEPISKRRSSSSHGKVRKSRESKSVACIESTCTPTKSSRRSSLSTTSPLKKQSSSSATVTEYHSTPTSTPKSQKASLSSLDDLPRRKTSSRACQTVIDSKERKNRESKSVALPSKDSPKLYTTSKEGNTSSSSRRTPKRAQQASSTIDVDEKILCRENIDCPPHMAIPSSSQTRSILKRNSHESLTKTPPSSRSVVDIRNNTDSSARTPPFEDPVLETRVSLLKVKVNKDALLDSIRSRSYAGVGKQNDKVTISGPILKKTVPSPSHRIALDKEALWESLRAASYSRHDQFSVSGKSNSKTDIDDKKQSPLSSPSKKPLTTKSILRTKDSKITSSHRVTDHDNNNQTNERNLSRNNSSTSNQSVNKMLDLFHGLDHDESPPSAEASLSSRVKSNNRSRSESDTISSHREGVNAMTPQPSSSKASVLSSHSKSRKSPIDRIKDEIREEKRKVRVSRSLSPEKAKSQVKQSTTNCDANQSSNKHGNRQARVHNDI